MLLNGLKFILNNGNLRVYGFGIITYDGNTFTTYPYKLIDSNVNSFEILGDGDDIVIIKDDHKKFLTVYCSFNNMILSFLFTTISTYILLKTLNKFII